VILASTVSERQCHTNDEVSAEKSLAKSLVRVTKICDCLRDKFDQAISDFDKDKNKKRK